MASKTQHQYTDLENIQRLVERFKRQLPNNSKYQERLAEEMELILKLKFTDYFIKICEVLDLTKDISHMTRGSAGSSLVCWLLGITDVDPIEWNIPLARFINPLRDDLPDVDIDFPHWRQEEVMNRIFDHYPGRSARISNYVMYKERSARREAAKRLGVKGNLPRNFTYEKLGIDVEEAQRIEEKLLGKKRCISKHCGGVLIMDRALPKSLITQQNQILLDKHEVEDLEHLKIDILANRGLSQLLEIDPTIKLEDYPKEDAKTAELLCRGDVLGVTQGESPAMRRLFRAIKPKSMYDCVWATALVRPVAMEGRKRASLFQNFTREAIDSAIVYEDDAIEQIARHAGIDHYKADQYRRAFAKGNDEKIMEFMELVGNHPKRRELIHELHSLSGFGLCKAHAINLGRLIWALAYQKAHNPKRFWEACLKHCQGSYRRWVYKVEAQAAGVNVPPGKNMTIIDEPEWQFEEYGWWQGKNFLERCYVKDIYLDYVELRGLIANGRVYKQERGKYVTFLMLGIGVGEYVDCVVPKAVSYHEHRELWLRGKVKSRNGTRYIEAQDWKVI